MSGELSWLLVAIAGASFALNIFLFLLFKKSLSLRLKQIVIK